VASLVSKTRCLWWNPHQAVPGGTGRQYDLVQVPEVCWVSEQQTMIPALPGVGMVVVFVIMLGVVELS